MLPLSLIPLAVAPRLRSGDAWEIMNVGVILALGILVAVVIVGVPLYRYLSRSADEEVPSNEMMLSQFQAARDAGEMDDLEFHRVRSLLKDRIVPGQATSQRETPARPASDDSAPALPSGPDDPPVPAPGADEQAP